MKLIVLLMIMVFGSCVTTPEPIEKFHGGVVIEKTNDRDVRYLVLKYKGDIVKVYAHKFDYNKYKLKDTIKCSSADLKYYEEGKDEHN